MSSSANLQRTPRFPTAELGLGLAYLLASLVAIEVTRASEGVALIWPANAIAAALLIRVSRLRVSHALVLVGLAAVVANTVAAGDTLPVAVGFSLINVFEIGLAVWIYRSLIRFPVPSINVGQAAHMTVVVGLAVPVLAALLGGTLVSSAFDKPWLESTTHWWLSDVLGMCLFGPPIILYRREMLRRLISAKFVVRNAAMALFCLGCCYLAIRYVSFPFVVISVPLLIAAVSMGGFGTAVLSLLSGLTILALWVAGILPSGLLPGTAAPSLAHLPLWALISTVMPAVAVGIGSDERRRNARKLQQSEQRFREALSHSPIGAVIVDMKGTCLESNVAAQSMLGYSSDELRAIPWAALTHADHRDEIARNSELLQSGARVMFDTERPLQCRDGTWVWTRIAVSIAKDEEGEPLHYIVQMESTEARRAVERVLAQERELLKTTLRAVGNGVITTDPDRRINYMNAAACEILGQAQMDVEGRRFEEVAVLTDPASANPLPDLVAQSIALTKVMRRAMACVLHRPDGTVSHVTLSVSPLSGSEGRVSGTVIVLQDVTKQFHRDQEVTRRARQDALTGLLNRFEYQRRAKRAFQRARLLDESAAVIAIDLDRFKSVNDAGGHAAGDAVLSRVSGVLLSLVRRADTVARIGGDEFAIIVENCAPERITQIAESILLALNPLQTEWEAVTHDTGASIGIAFMTEDFEDEAAWLTAADQACYSAKRAGRGRLVVAEGALHPPMRVRQ